jgi:hypothetical protein
MFGGRNAAGTEDTYYQENTLGKDLFIHNADQVAKGYHLDAHDFLRNLYGV